MPARLTSEDIEQMLRHVAFKVRTPRRFILFGGCAMCQQGIKDSTKDVDALIVPATEYPQLIREMRDADFWYLVNEAMNEIEPQDERDQLDRMEMWWGPHGWHFDMFPPHAIWHRGLRFSDEMQSRVTPWFEDGVCRVEVADPSTIFLLKSVTGRWRNEAGRDLDDLETIWSQGLLDETFVIHEWRRQSAALGPDAIEYAREAVAALRERGFLPEWSP